MPNLRLKGKIGEQEITVLIDCRATHNFISHEVTRELGIKVEKGQKFTDQVGGGHELKS